MHGPASGSGSQLRLWETEPATPSPPQPGTPGSAVGAEQRAGEGGTG